MVRHECLRVDTLRAETTSHITEQATAYTAHIRLAKFAAPGLIVVVPAAGAIDEWLLPKWAPGRDYCGICPRYEIPLAASLLPL
jgi:hypothetical protein